MATKIDSGFKCGAPGCQSTECKQIGSKVVCALCGEVKNPDPRSYLEIPWQEYQAHAEETRAARDDALKGRKKASTGKKRGGGKAKLGKSKKNGRGRSARLGPTEAAKVRELYATGEYSQQVLGSEFGVSDSTINAIVNKKGRWANV